MLPAPLAQAIDELASLDPEHEEAVLHRWRDGVTGPSRPGAPSKLPEAVIAATDALSAHLPPLLRDEEGLAHLAGLLGKPGGEVVFAWCLASTWRRDVELAHFLALASADPAFRERVPAVARDRVVCGPLLDALACATLLGDGTVLAQPVNAEARARLEILIWEAGASGREVPVLGRWVW